MAFRDQTIEVFIQELSSKAPIPGGGGASALVGALSASLTHMVGALTVGKPKYAAVEAEMQELLNDTEALANRFLALMDEDAEAFEPLAQAYRLPKETDEEKANKAVLRITSYNVCYTKLLRTNYCDIGLSIDVRTQRAIIVSVSSCSTIRIFSARSLFFICSFAWPRNS